MVAVAAVAAAAGVGDILHRFRVGVEPREKWFGLGLSGFFSGIIPVTQLLLVFFSCPKT